MINGGYGRKMVVKELFGKVKIYRLHTRVDNRGSLPMFQNAANRVCIFTILLGAKKTTNIDMGE